MLFKYGDLEGMFLATCTSMMQQISGRKWGKISQCTDYCKLVTGLLVAEPDVSERTLMLISESHSRYATAS